MTKQSRIAPFVRIVATDGKAYPITAINASPLGAGGTTGPASSPPFGVGPTLLRMDYINSLPQPFIARFYGGDEWPIHDIDVETGLVRIDVCGLLQVKHIGDVRSFRDAEGAIHAADDFYTESGQ